MVVMTQSAEAAATVENTVIPEKETGTDTAPRARDTNEAIAREVTERDLEAVETTEIVMTAIVAIETVAVRETEAIEVTEAIEATETGNVGIATVTMTDTKGRAEIAITADKTDDLDAMIATEIAAEDVRAGVAAHRGKCRPCWMSTVSFPSTREYESLITGMCHHQDTRTRPLLRSRHSVRTWTFLSYRVIM